MTFSTLLLCLCLFVLLGVLHIALWLPKATHIALWLPADTPIALWLPIATLYGFIAHSNNVVTGYKYNEMPKHLFDA